MVKAATMDSTMDTSISVRSAVVAISSGRIRVIPRSKHRLVSSFGQGTSTAADLAVDDL